MYDSHIVLQLSGRAATGSLMSHSVSRVRAYPNDGSVRRDPVVLQATDMASMMDTATKSLGLPWSARRIFTITGREVPHQH